MGVNLSLYLCHGCCYLRPLGQIVDNEQQAFSMVAVSTSTTLSFLAKQEAKFTSTKIQTFVWYARELFFENIFYQILWITYEFLKISIVDYIEITIYCGD
jgi:hypothetical protein